MSISISSNTQKNIIDNKEFRCPKCSLIPFINISSNNNKIFMSILCTNNHYYSNSFDEMQIMCKTNSILNNLCNVCNVYENEINKNNSNYYCSKLLYILLFETWRST